MHAGAKTMTLFPGGPYQSVLIPLDYAPSRDYRPRWGHSQRPHALLAGLLARFQQDYREVLAGLGELRGQLANIKQIFESESAPEPGWLGGPITSLDCALLYYFVYRYRPRVYLEIGSGLTTCFARRAVDDHNIKTKIVSIDPSPRANIESICDEVHRDGLETADLAVFQDLQPGDIVFVDGSHRSFMNSDVTVFMLDILPQLRPGVVIHFHDIFLPYDYPDMFRDWYWNEQYLLGAYLLAAPDRVRVLMPSYYVALTDGLLDSLGPPPVDLGANNESWRHGGSFWFTHTPEP